MCADLRTPVYTIPEGKNFLALATIYQTHEGKSFDLNHNQLSSSDNAVFAQKCVLRKAFWNKVEWSAEFQYINRDMIQIKPNGISKKYDSQGFSDLRLRMTYPYMDGRRNKWGMLFAGETKLPTGKQEDGLGTGSLDFTFFSLISRKAKPGISYFIYGYMLTGRGCDNEVVTEYSDEIFISLGFKSRKFRNVSFNLRYSYFIQTEESITQNNGVTNTMEKYNYPGFRVEVSRFTGKHIEWMCVYERYSPDNHSAFQGEKGFLKEPGFKEKFAVVMKYKW